MSFDYGGLRVEPDTGSTTFDRDRRRLIRRDPAFEQAALARLPQLGFSRQWDSEFSRPLLAIAASRFPQVVRELVREGWRVEAEGRAVRSAEALRSEVRSGIDWFELHGGVDFGDGGRALPRLLAALRHGRRHRHAGRRQHRHAAGGVAEEVRRASPGMGEAEGDHLRFKASQVACSTPRWPRSPRCEVDERFARVRERAAVVQRHRRRSTPPPAFAGQLRDYQREALGWLEFLRQFGFGGCLADDMGLGKTVQVLALLDRLPRGPARVARTRRWSSCRGRSSSTGSRRPRASRRSCASSTTPAARARSTGFDELRPGPDDLRHAAARRHRSCKDIEFDYVILDEAQAIKNAATARRPRRRGCSRGKHRLALSGTPIENHLGELWSLFEFLNPGMLGTARGRSRRHSGRRGATRVEAMDAPGRRPAAVHPPPHQGAGRDGPAREVPSRRSTASWSRPQRKLYDELREPLPDLAARAASSATG